MKFPELIFVRVPESDERRERIEQAVFAALGGEQEAQPPELFPIGSVATTTQLAAGSVSTTTDAVAEPQPPPPLTLDGSLPDHIQVAVPTSDARRDRIERDVFAQLGAIRTATRTDEIVAFNPKARWTPWLATASVAVAATIAVVMLWKRPAGPLVTGPQSPMEWKAPEGGTFTYGDAVMVAGKDTKVLASTAPDGTVTLDLDRGSVDCDVEARPGRAPFRVIAGDIRVEVIGTRFTVTRRASGVRVDVTRGKVKVRDQNGEFLVATGETWPSSLAGSDVPDDAGVSEESELEMPEMPISTHRTAPRAKTARDPSDAEYHEAVVLMSSDVSAAERAFQKLAKGKGTSARGSLVMLSDIEGGRGHIDTALGYLDEHDRRFPNSTEAQEVAFLRFDMLRRAHRNATDAARQYLARFPKGTYVEQVTDYLRRR